MKKYIYMMMAGGLIALAACSKENELNDEPNNGNQVTVGITTEVQTKAAVVTGLGDGDEMNVYAKTYGKVDAPDLVEGIKATCSGGSWSLAPEVKLSEGGKAFIYAVYPYVEGLKNLSAVPVDVSRQEDVLYSGGYVPVTYTTHTAKLTMKHALALTTFNICSQGYSGQGTLQSISLAGEQVYTSGTMNVENGKVTGTGQTAFALTLSKQIASSGWQEELPRLWSIPFSTKAQTALLKATIDGKEYEAAFPEVEMRSGFQYIFRMVLTDYGLEFIPDQTETISLNTDTDQMGELNDYGVLLITHRSSLFQLPTLTGDNVFGSVDWGDGTADSYSIGGTHTYSDSGEKTARIESWNSNGFSLSNLEGIESVDISLYQ